MGNDDFRRGMQYGFALALAAVEAEQADCAGACAGAVRVLRAQVSRPLNAVDQAPMGISAEPNSWWLNKATGFSQEMWEAGVHCPMCQMTKDELGGRRCFKIGCPARTIGPMVRGTRPAK